MSATACVTVQPAPEPIRVTYTARLEPDALPSADPIDVEVGSPVTYGLTIYSSPTFVSQHAEGIPLTIVNRTADAVTIDWDRCALTDADGQSRRVIHGGVRLQARNESQAPSTIAPGARLSDVIYPADAIEWRSAGRYSNWKHNIFLPRAKAGETYEGTIALTYAVTVSGQQQRIITQRVKLSVTSASSGGAGPSQ